MRLLRAIFFLLCLPVVFSAHGQETGESDSLTANAPLVTIGSIHITGQKRTKEFIIRRELSFRPEQQLTMQQLLQELERTREQLMNTLLFVDVSVYVASVTNNVAAVSVHVKERWYFFPIPYFRLADRNFNQWWVDQNRSLDRVNYGLKFTQQNTTGRNDELNIWLITGYTRQFTLRYHLPFFDSKLRHGFSVGFSSVKQKEINYATRDNKQQFLRLENAYSREWLKAEFMYSYRPDVRQRHYLKFTYNDERIADTVTAINPNYYPDSKTRLRYPDFTYQYRYINVDYIAYPTRGLLLDGSLYKRGFNKASDLWQVSLRGVYALPVWRKGFLHWEALATARFPSNDHFFNQRMIGYGFYQLRGLEYNVVDGTKGAVLKTTFNQQVYSFVLRNPFKSKTHDQFPIRFFLKAFGDLGYAHSRNPHVSNTLSNSLLRTYGVGLDIVSVYDFVLKIEYSFNQLGRDGLYLQTRNNF